MNKQTAADIAAYNARQAYIREVEQHAQEREARRNQPPARPTDELSQSWWDSALRQAGVDPHKAAREEAEGEAFVAETRALAHPLPELDTGWLNGYGDD